MDEHNKPPFSNAYWVIPGQFAAGEYPGSTDPDVMTRKIQGLIDKGIDHIIDLTTPEDRLMPYMPQLRQMSTQEVNYRPYPIMDLGVPHSPDYMREILDDIETALHEGRNVYVHCWGGIGRTGTVIGSYFVRKKMSGEQAIHHLARLWRGVEKYHRRPESPETPEQFAWIRNWAQFDTKQYHALEEQ